MFLYNANDFLYSNTGETLITLYFLTVIWKIFNRMASPVTIFYVSIFTIISASAGFTYDPHGRGFTDEITTKQGKLVGLKVEFKSSSHLRPVEVYLGIPYAAAPTGSLRFMPPGSPPQWKGVKYVNKHPAVCPQNPPDINEERKKMTMSEGRANYLRRLLPYLVQDQQDEDCLYLNIFAPAQKRGSYKSKLKYPVIVFIHGESFEWNSGNPYDGSVLASYGEVVVVTINFRLGILGFLRPGVGDNTLTNFGLLDQIAALQWVKENIELFGGDPKCVTLMGHGTGAACVNYLMVSPVSRGVGGSGLFHRAILMSGTALADWALTTSNVFTIQVAQALNCPLKETNNEMTECLQKRRLDEIMAVKVAAPEFKTRFGPMVDGSVVPNDPFHVTGEYKDLFGRYELLYGVTELESYNLLDAVSLHYGMLEQERDKKIRSYVQERFEYLPDMYLAETLKAYTDVTRRTSESSSQSIAENNRNTLLDILSDARVVAPMVQTANFHSSANPKSYFYVFSHRNTYGDYESARIGKSIHGEELPYVFGVPLVNGHFPKYPFSTPEQGFPSHPHFTDTERLLSEAIITFWTNFAKTGNPNAPSRKLFLTQDDLDWKEYDTTNKTYLSLGIPPKMSHRYRQKLMDFWNDHITDIFRNLPPNESSKREERPEILPPEPYPRPPFFPLHPERNPEVISWRNGLPVFSTTPSPHVYGTVVKSVNEKPRSASTGLLAVDRGFGSKFQLTSTPKATDVTPEVEADNSSSMAMSIVIVVGVCFLLVNIFAFAGLYYQRDRLKVQERMMKKRYEDVENTNNEDYYVKKLPEERVDDNEIVTLEKINKKENKKKKTQHSGDELYEAVRSREKTLDGHEGMIVEEEVGEGGFKKWKLSRQCSTSTMDPHTKVREWIAHEIVQRCSPRFLRRTKFQRPTTRPVLQNDNSFDTFIENVSSAIAPADSKNQTPSSPALSKPTTTTTLQRSKVKKVSVAVDATPGARGSSVLKQIPVEQMSKSMEELGLGKCVSTKEITLEQKKARLKRSETCRESLARSSSSSDPTNRDTVLRRSTSISLQLYQPPNKVQNSGLNIFHQHSKSDPVPHSTKQNITQSINSQNQKIANISLETERECHDVNSKSFPQKQFKSFKSGPSLKGKAAKEVPIPVMPTSNIPKDINVTSRDSSDKNDKLPYIDPLKTIQRRNFPKVLPDLPPSQEIINDDQDSTRELSPMQTIAAKRRSLPPPLHLLAGIDASESDVGSSSQPTTPTDACPKDINIYTTTGKVPPPPPPRISTLGRKPTNTVPITPLSSSFDSQDSVNMNTTTSSSTYQQRQEPRFIIKPTSTAPVSRNPSLLHQGRSKPIPRVVPNSGEEYPLTPTAVHHQYCHNTSPNEITSPLSSLTRQNSLRNQGPQPPVIQTTLSKNSAQSQLQPSGLLRLQEKSHSHQLKSPEEIPATPHSKSTTEPLIQEQTAHHTTKLGAQHVPKTSTKRVDASTVTQLQGKPFHQHKVPSKKSTELSTISSVPTEETSSNTGTVRRVKKGDSSKSQGTGDNSGISSTSPTKTTAMSKAWYAQYNQSFLSKSKDSDN